MYMRAQVCYDLSDMVLCESSILEALSLAKENDDVSRCVFYAVRTLCRVRKYEEANELFEKYEKLEGSDIVETFVALTRAMLYIEEEENLSGAEAVIPNAQYIEDLSLEERLDAFALRLQLWTEYGFYDKVAEELEELEKLCELKDAPLRFQHKAQAYLVAASLFLREYDIVKRSSLMEEFVMLPSFACNEITRIVMPYWANMVTLSHEFLPMLRNFHYGVMTMVFRGLSMISNKNERLIQPKLLLDLCRVCSNMFCYDWVIDDQCGRTSFLPYQHYLYGYLELRDELYMSRERLRKLYDVSDSHDDLQGTGWIFISIAQVISVSEVEKARVLLAKAYYRCLWRQADKCDMLISRQHDMLPTRILQMELNYIRAFQFYVCEKWEAFLFHHEQALLFWESFGVSRASSLQRHSRLLPLHKALCTLLSAYHMHHTLEHHNAVAAMEKHRCMFLENVPNYNINRPFDHIPPQTTVVYFILVNHLTEVWTSVKLHEEEYQNQVVPQLWAYNYYRKKSQGPGEGTLTLLPQVKDQALFAAQQWENAKEKEHSVLSAVHLAIKPQLDSIVGIYKTYAQRCIIVPEDSLCNTPWPSMPSSNQKWFCDMINANNVPGLGFYCVNEELPERPKLSQSLLVSCRDHMDRREPIFKYGHNELRIGNLSFPFSFCSICSNRYFICFIFKLLII